MEILSLLKIAGFVVKIFIKTESRQQKFIKLQVHKVKAGKATGFLTFAPG